jgi:hypothetical protein
MSRPGIAPEKTGSWPPAASRHSQGTPLAEASREKGILVNLSAESEIFQE